MLATARVPPAVEGEIGRLGTDLFGHKLEQSRRRSLILFEHPTGMV